MVKLFLRPNPACRNLRMKLFFCFLKACSHFLLTEIDFHLIVLLRSDEKRSGQGEFGDEGEADLGISGLAVT